MEHKKIKDIIEVIRLGKYSVPISLIPTEFRSTILPPDSWDKLALENFLGIKIPLDLETLWNEASAMRLFEDITYGQWGLIIWSPSQLPNKQKQEKDMRARDFRSGDLIIGEFLGDSELLMIRADPTALDYGWLTIVLPIDAREDWPIVARTLNEFLVKLLDNGGNKFWVS